MSREDGRWDLVNFVEELDGEELDGEELVEVTNEERRTSARVALQSFADHNSLSISDELQRLKILTDLLCDLMHWADIENLEFEDCVDDARHNHRFEVEEEEA